MPISRYHIRSAHSLADPELHHAADKDDSEALLEAVAMSGLVGFLRQLGDLAQFAAELFHDLHEEVMATAERGHSLISRVQQIEAEIPPLEKAFLSRTHHPSFFTNGGIDWCPNLRSEQNLVSRGDLPRFIMDSYEECRGPPRLFLLDKFDVAGAGACLKRYSDPSFFKAEPASSVSVTETVEAHRERKIRKVKQKKGEWRRDGETPGAVLSHSKLHQLFLEERIENACSDPARLVKLKKRQFDGSAVEAKSGRSYMEEILEMTSPDHQMACETSINPLPVKLMSNDTSETGIEILEINGISHMRRSIENGKTHSSNEQEFELNSCSEVGRKTNGYLVKEPGQISSGGTGEVSSKYLKVPDETELVDDDGQNKSLLVKTNGYLVKEPEQISSGGIGEVSSKYLKVPDETELVDDDGQNKSLLVKTNGYLVKEPEQISSGGIGEVSSKYLKVPDETELVDDDGQNKREGSLDCYHSDDAASEVDDYMDALATIDSELEIDNECGPKKSSLNVQKLIDSNGEEEHQLQAPFSDSQSFGDSSLSEEMSSYEQDRSKENNEVQAQLPDSRSAGTPCASDDDNSSFRRDRTEEHTQLHAQLSDFQSIGNSSLETENMLSNQLPQTGELKKIYDEFVTRDDAHDLEGEISDSEPVSSGSCPVDSGCLLLSSDHGATALSDKTPHVPVERHLRLEDDEDTISLIKDNNLPVVYFDNISLNNLDVCNPHVHSHTTLQVSNDLNLAHEGECGDHSDIKVMQEESHNEHCSEISTFGDIGSRGENSICLPMELDLNLGTKMQPDDWDLQSDDDIKAMQLDSEDLFPVVETTVENSFAEELFSDFIHGNPQHEPDSVEVKILYPDQLSNVEEVPKIMFGSERNESTCSLDQVEEDDLIKHPPSPNYIPQDDDIVVNDMFPVKDLAVSAISSLDNAEIDASVVNCQASSSISSPSINPSNLLESFPASPYSNRMEMESNEIELTKISLDLNAEKRENQLEPFSDMTSPVSSLTNLEESPSTFDDSHWKNLEVSEEVARDSLTEFTSHLVVDQLKIASTDELLSLNRSDSSNSSICNNFQCSLHKEKDQDSSSLNDMKMVTQCSELDSQDSESTIVCKNDLQNSKGSFSPPSYNQLEPETHLEWTLKPRVVQHDVGFLLKNEEKCTSSKFEPHPMQISNQLEGERINCVASEFSAEVHLEESSDGSASKSSDQKISPSKHFTDPLKPLLPNLSPKATKINLEETPPMPPLPPMQWITSRVQNASLVSEREELGVSQVLFQPVQQVKPDYNSQFDLSTSERVALPYQNPFLPAVAVESNKSLRSSGLSAGISEHPVAIPLQLPVMVNDANGQHNYQVLERSQIHNPFLALPMLSYGWLPHGRVEASEGESILKSNPCPPIHLTECAVPGADTSNQQEKLSQFKSQLVEDTSIEAKKDSPGECVLNSSSWPPILPTECAVPGADTIFQQDKQTQSSGQIMEDTCFEAKKDSPGELHSVLPAECPVSGDDPLSSNEQHSDSPNALMEETVLEFTTDEEPSIHLEREQGDHIFSPKPPPPSIEIVQPNHSLLPSEGDVALSLDTSAQSSEFDDQIPNGKSKKLPPPQNHLFDVVAALDKSRLRKVTDRVRPPIAPKVDERDSLLEQIRTKSFNLRPAVVTRPNIQGPKTNLRVAAILEKANSIRQALAGSDEDDDAWSDC
ncbi:protein SCAR2 isoform X7 [Lathyrus oleraceus]|uniref:protein SCAR2 isoform X7 n=1 Tax=Pisum sativum TaxID=3888 RepID=UPI0021D29AAC|nr:protein SCAR2-like isoform X7 [Pisum sativum]